MKTATDHSGETTAPAHESLNSLGLPAGTFFKAGTGLTTNADQDNDAYTLFGQADWKVADKLTLTGGLAYLGATVAAGAVVFSGGAAGIAIAAAVAAGGGGAVEDEVKDGRGAEEGGGAPATNAAAAASSDATRN